MRAVKKMRAIPPMSAFCLRLREKVGRLPERDERLLRRVVLLRLEVLFLRLLLLFLRELVPPRVEERAFVLRRVDVLRLVLLFFAAIAQMFLFWHYSMDYVDGAVGGDAPLWLADALQLPQRLTLKQLETI